jgi:hypothetical protein
LHLCETEPFDLGAVEPIVLRAPHGAICAILVLATDVSRYKLTEQLVRWVASLDAGDDSSTSSAGSLLEADWGANATPIHIDVLNALSGFCLSAAAQSRPA